MSIAETMRVVERRIKMDGRSFILGFLFVKDEFECKVRLVARWCARLIVVELWVGMERRWCCW
jgi:hypothetical protein